MILVLQVSKVKGEQLKVKGALPAPPQWATLLDTKGPEIRTAMLRDHKPITLEAGQAIIIEAVGDRYTSFEGYKDEKETRIGLSYDKLCSSVSVGNKILLADGSLSIQVEEILSPTELRGTVLNSKSLGERKNGNLPGVKVDIPVLTAKDIDDLQNFAAKHQMDYVAASFVQSKADVEFIRRILDEAGGKDVREETLEVCFFNSLDVLAMLYCEEVDSRHCSRSVHKHSSLGLLSA
jgi:pyruvate kinase